MSERIPPSHDSLTRFLRERRPQSIAEAAALLGWPAAQVESEARENDALLPDRLVAWRELALWLLDSWPLATLADVLPAGLQPVPMLLDQPAYIVTALRAQWHIEPMPHRALRPLTFADYMTDLLHRAILPQTVEALSGDEEFMRAYDFPEDAE